ncbi:uncharacterized protein LOC106383827 [Brassica napus]|uniref:uncharacterized protein LOC106383827 n=1 Tax=Brassica napus TaxID=3708 RepID=UPI0006AACD0F|nr:uncharacterized protein LOC106383827 [Brassica napus]
MSIIGDSKIKDSDFHCDDMFFSFASFEDVEVIGQVESLKDVQTVQVKQKDRKKVEFRLRDTKGEPIACCLWGKYAEQIESHVQEANDPNMILVIRFAKIGFYQGEVQITNAFDASLVLINPDLPEVIDFQKHIESCKIIVSIETIDTDWGWFYFGHDRCNKRAKQIVRDDSTNLTVADKPLWYCKRCRCNVTNVSPKYKLHIVVQDDSGTCKLMLLDTEAQAIIGCKSVELWDGSYDEIEDPEVLPGPIKELVGQSFCFGVALENDNVTNGSDIFVVSEIWSGDKLLKAESHSVVSRESSMISGGEVSKSDPNSQTTFESCSTPFSKRKDGDLPDMSSSSKKLCTKIVKVEKSKKD